VYKVLWAIAGLAAVALATAIFGTVVSYNDARAQSARVSAVEHKESTDRSDIDKLRAEVGALIAGHSASP
jgi:hypothetical protein